MGRLLCLDPPPLNPAVPNCPASQLSHPFQHNNSLVAPGASCYPGLSFVLLLLSLLDWMNGFFPCDSLVFPSSSALITSLRLNQKGRMMDACFGQSMLTANSLLHPWNMIKPISFRISTVSVSVNFDVNLFIVWKCLAWSFPFGRQPFPSMWPLPGLQHCRVCAKL